MFVLAQGKTRQTLMITGRRLFAAVLAIVAMTNLMTVVIELPWNSIVVTEPLLDLGGPVWERDSLIVTGLLLLLVARALVRGKRQAWWLSVGFLTFLLTSAHGSHFDRSTILLALSLLILLLALAPLFPTRSDTRTSIQGYIALVFGLGCAALHIIVSRMWQATGGMEVLVLHNGVLFLLHVLTFLLLAYGVIQVLHPVCSARPCLRQEHADVYEIVRRYGDLATIHFALNRDKSYFWSETGRTIISYRVVRGVALALGDPIGPREEHAQVLQAFLSFCRQQDWSIALYQASERSHFLCQEGGLNAYKIGEEALIDVSRFTLQGKLGAPVRHAVTRARREDLSVQCWQGEGLPQTVFSGMQQISTEWLGTRSVQTQMGFSMGRFPADWSEELLTVVAVDSRGEVVAFLTWTPLYASNGWALDTMRRGNRTPPGAMELLIVHSVEWAQVHGYTRMSLGLASLRGVGEETLPTPYNADEQKLHTRSAALLERWAASLHQRGIILGSHRSLAAFKSKFQPTWEARYLIVSEGQELPRVLLALAQVHSSGWWSLLKEAWRTVRPDKTILKAVVRLLCVGNNA